MGLARSVREGRGPYRGRPTGDRRTLVVPTGVGHDARTRSIEWARRLVCDPATVYLDTETTGLDGGAEVVDIAVVAADGRLLLDTLVRPIGRIPAGATRVHGIREADVRDAPGWQEIHDLLCDLLADRPVVVYNAAFDRRIVAQCCARHRVDDPRPDWHCAMVAYAEFRGDRSGHGGGYRWFKLEEAAADFGALAGGHRAAADARACRAVVVGMAGASMPE